MANLKKSNRKNLPVYVYKITNSGPNRRHIEIPSRDRPVFQSVGLVAVIPLDDCVMERLEKALGAEFKLSLTQGVVVWLR